MGEFNSDDHYFYYVGKNPLEEMQQPSQSTKEPEIAGTWAQSQTRQDDIVHFQGKPFNITIIQVYAPTAKAEVKWFYEDLEDLLDLTPNKDVLFIIGEWNAKIDSQEILGVTGKFGLGVQNEAEQGLTKVCHQNILVIANTLFQQHKGQLYTWTSPDGQY